MSDDARDEGMVATVSRLEATIDNLTTWVGELQAELQRCNVQRIAAEDTEHEYKRQIGTLTRVIDNLSVALVRALGRTG